MTTWTAPSVDRTFEPYVGDERTLLGVFLDFHRRTLLWKCSGLTADQLKTAAVEPSGLSLLGLVRHMTEVERAWFTRRVAGQDVSRLYDTDDTPDGDFNAIADADAEADYAAYLAECDRSREVLASVSLDDTFIHPRHQKEMSVRWVCLHMIEEYARHNGHADLIRERIDGATGE